MSITKIYLVTNCYNDPNKVYIGKTKNHRESNHKKRFGEQIDYNYIDEVNSLDYKDWEPLETYWIEQFRQWGFEVLNKRKKGGSGPEYQTKITKDKISKTLVGRTYKEEWKIAASKPKPQGFGEKMKNKERIQKISNSNRKHYEKGSERNQKISNSLMGKKHSQETKSKLSKPKPQGFGEKIKSKERNQKIGKANSKPIIQMKENQIINQYESITQASLNTGISIGAISACLRKTSKTSGGYIWIYK
jgi:hypothetical protein